MKKLMKQLKVNKNLKGFTLVEVIMVILLISILAIIGVSQFTNYQKDAKNSATKANLKILRNAIASQNGQMRLKCGVTSTTFPPVANVTANDITNDATTVASNGSPCTHTQAASGDRYFVMAGIPANPWSTTASATVALCAGTGCTARSDICGGGATRAAARRAGRRGAARSERRSRRRDRTRRGG